MLAVRAPLAPIRRRPPTLYPVPSPAVLRDWVERYAPGLTFSREKIREGETETEDTITVARGEVDGQTVEIGHAHEPTLLLFLVNEIRRRRYRLPPLGEPDPRDALERSIIEARLLGQDDVAEDLTRRLVTGRTPAVLNIARGP